MQNVSKVALKNSTKNKEASQWNEFQLFLFSN